MFGLRAKLLAGLSSLLAILIAVTLLANRVLTRYSDSIQELFREDYASAAASHVMMDALARMIQRAQLAAAAGSSGTESPADAATTTAPAPLAADPDISLFAQQLRSQSDIANLPGERDATNRLRDAWTRFNAAYVALDDRALDAARKREVLAHLHPSAAEIRRQARQIIDMNLADLDVGRGAAHRMAARAARAMHWLAVLGIGVAGAIVLLAGSVVLRPVQALERSARQIAGGNLELSVPVRSRDEIGRLGAAFNDMAAQLREFKRLDHQKLLRTQHTTQLAIDSLPDAVVVIDPRGRIELTNQTAWRLFSLRPDMNVIEMPTPWLSDLHRRALAQGGPHQRAGYVSAIRVDDDGDERFFLPRTFPIFDENQDVIGSAIVLADVTELRRLDELKNGLLSTAAHELKTPLTSIRMIMHLVVEERIGPLNVRQRDLLTAAREDSDRLHQIVQTLLDVERIRSGRALMEASTLPAEELLRRCVEPRRAEVESRGLKLRVESADSAGVVHADPQRLAHVFDNLIDNAMRFTPRGGTITVSTAPSDAGTHFAVADNGSGIPEAFKHRVFERFFRAPGQSGDTGTGLGLTIVKEIVEAHGGRVWVESHEGKGTTVNFILPRVSVQQSKEIAHDHEQHADPAAVA